MTRFRGWHGGDGGVRACAVACGRERSCAVVHGRAWSCAIVRGHVRSCAVGCVRRRLCAVVCEFYSEPSDSAFVQKKSSTNKI